MAREIRRVPSGWEHPKDSQGHYIPLYDQSYEEALAEWESERLEYEQNPNPEYTFIEWNGEAPSRDDYHPKWSGEPTHYQVYENVTEGTPISPVFASLARMESWLLWKGYSKVAAARFVEGGWAPSFVIVGGKMSGLGIHSLDLLGNENETEKDSKATRQDNNPARLDRRR